MFLPDGVYSDKFDPRSPKDMDDKTKGIVATIAAVVLCGCPGLFLCFFGAISIFASAVPGAEIDVFGSNSPAAGTTMGFVFLCLSLILIATPVVVGYYTLRKKPGVITEDVPPTS
jgi:hypothetical protein